MPNITHALLRQLAGDRAFERGVDYFATGHVTNFTEKSGLLTATVRGSVNYRAGVWMNTNPIQHECTCPVGRDGIFCKHCVAVALTWLQQNAPDSDAAIRLQTVSALKQKRSSATPKRTRATQTPIGNVEATVAMYRKDITDAFRVRRFIDYYAAREYAARIRDVIGTVESLLNIGQAAAVIALTEHALKCLERAIDKVDDSDGHRIEILQWLHALHLAACTAARPEPKALAKRLFAWELRSDLEVFYQAVHRYADILGPSGLAVYRTLASSEWVTIRALAPGQTERTYNPKRFRVTRMMEALALATDDIDALVAVKQRDLSVEYRFVQIVEVLENANRFTEALQWAERGMKAFPDTTDHRLRETLARQYARGNRHDEALAIVWFIFRKQPTLQRVQQLQQYATATNAWPEWRAKAVQAERDAIAKYKASAKFPPSEFTIQGTASLLVEILLWEGTPDLAWKEAQDHGCTSALWMQLARIRENEHPNDAATIYEQAVGRALKDSTKRAYHDSVALMQMLGRAMHRAGRQPEFTMFINGVRVKHKLRKNLLKLMDVAF